MSSRADEITTEQFFDQLTPEALTERLASRLSMDEDDSLVLEAKFDEVRKNLLPILQDTVLDIRLYGSLTRRTRLSTPYDPAPDIDCLLVLDANVFMERYVFPSTRPELLWAQDIQDRLRNSKEFSLISDPPFLSLRRGDDIFELTMSTTVQEEDGGSALYSIYGAITEEENAVMGQRDSEAEVDSDEDTGEEDTDEEDREASLDLDSPDFFGFERNADEDIEWTYENMIISGEPISPDGKLFGMILTTNPFFYNGLLEQYLDIYGEYWRYLILLWKYWKKSCRSPVRSYVIEDNVFKGLKYPQPFAAAADAGRITFLHFTATYFGNRKLYDYKLFERDESFCRFRDGLIRADNLSRSGSKADALHILAQIFEPWEPNWDGR